MAALARSPVSRSTRPATVTADMSSMTCSNWWKSPPGQLATTGQNSNDVRRDC